MRLTSSSYLGDQVRISAIRTNLIIELVAHDRALIAFGLKDDTFPGWAEQAPGPTLDTCFGAHSV
ncbi:hypothetical protein ACFYUK_00475 [Nonomuraea wenchangensis]